MFLYSIGTCFLCQKCLKCDLNTKTVDKKKRKSYSRVYDPKTKSRIYNNLQLSELDKANKTYSYEVNFSQKFNYCLCPLCHNLMSRLKKNQTTKNILTKSKPSNESSKKLRKVDTISTKSQKLTKISEEINNFGSSDGDEVEEID